MPPIVMGMLKNNAEKSTARTKEVHSEKVTAISQDLSQLKNKLPVQDKMAFGFDNTELHRGKILIKAEHINHEYDGSLLWSHPLSLVITSGERVVIMGQNGAGKTSLIYILIGRLKPKTGSVFRADHKAIYIDQDYSLIDNQLTVYTQAQQFNHTSLQEHEVKIRLNRFLFLKEDWHKPCQNLSGGEKMRLMLCCLTISNKAPDLIILDEPTNNLDIQNIEILTSALNNYLGTLILVTHDEYFLEEIRIERSIILA